MAESTQSLSSEPKLPRVTIRYCTQCKWMLRAAYYAQELLSTFSVSLGEVALQPATGGVFTVEITTTTTTTTAAAPSQTQAQAEAEAEVTTTTTTTTTTERTVLLWDRKTDGGFPETKELKRRVRDVVQPGRDLGHVDRDYHHGRDAGKQQQQQQQHGDGGAGEGGNGGGGDGDGHGGQEVKREAGDGKGATAAAARGRRRRRRRRRSSLWCGREGEQV
ncbi:hypothetical protein VTH82DRAFT_755 [Thermothelomyces myriococcoides]